MQAAILLGVAFVWWERRAPNPMITPGLIANTQFRSANLGMLFFAAGAIGSLLLLSLVFLNLWGYEPIEAALALAAGAALRPDRVAVRGQRRRHAAAGRDRQARADRDGDRPALDLSFLPVDRGRRLGLPAHPARPRADRDRHGHRLPRAQRGRDGRGGRARGGAGVGRAQHRAPARRGDRRGDPGRHLRRRPARAHVVVRRRRDRGHRRRVGDRRSRCRRR